MTELRFAAGAAPGGGPGTNINQSDLLFSGLGEGMFDAVRGAGAVEVSLGDIAC